MFSNRCWFEHCSSLDPFSAVNPLSDDPDDMGLFDESVAGTVNAPAAIVVPVVGVLDEGRVDWLKCPLEFRVPLDGLEIEPLIGSAYSLPFSPVEAGPRNFASERKMILRSVERFVM